METVTAYAALLVTARYCEATDRRLQRGMERRIEASDLHQVRSKRKQRSGRRTDTLPDAAAPSGVRRANSSMVLLVNRAGATNCDPPCTMRCPTAARPPLPALLVGPLQDIVQNVRLASGVRASSRSRTLLPSMSLTVRCGLSPISATSPANRYAGSAPVDVEQTELDAGGSGVQGEHCFRHRRHLV